MPDYKMFTVKVSYEADVMLRLSTDKDDAPDFQGVTRTLEAFGARDIAITSEEYTGRGEHEFVGSKDPGLQHLAVCVKCLKRRDVAALTTCPGAA